MNFRTVFLCLFFCFFCTGCQHSAASFLWPESESCYNDVTRKWTRHHVFYNGIETVLEVHVLAQSWEWRQAWLKKNAEDYVWPAAERQARQEIARKECSRGLECIVAVAGERGKGLQTSRSPWKLYLRFDGRQIEALEVRKLEWPKEKMQSNLYFWTPWQQVYNVRFPEVPQGNYSVVFAGPFGPGSFSWDEAN